MPSAIGGIVGLVGGGKTPSAPNVQTWQPTGTSDMDTLWQSLLKTSANNNPYETYAPQAKATFDAAYNNPLAAGYQTAANNAGTAFDTVGNNAVSNSASLAGTVDPTLSAGKQVLDMGFDPQNALKQRMLQQLTDQSSANSYRNGTAGSPYAASVADNNGRNFEIDWQAAQLDRALKALSGYTGATGSAGNTATAAANTGTAGAAALNNAGGVPFAASNTITDQQGSALKQLLAILGTQGSQAFTSQSLGDIMNYLSLGANQSNMQAELDLKNFANKLAAAQASQGGLGGLVSAGLTGLGNFAGTSAGSSILGSFAPYAAALA